MTGKTRRQHDAGLRMHELMCELYPFFRGMTGDGVRRTLTTLATRGGVPVCIHEAPSGGAAYDWNVPREWRFGEAYVQDTTGRRVIDAAWSNLHVVSHSQPVRALLPWSALRPRLHTLPDRPEWVPYRHAFLQDDWGFCLSHEAMEEIEAAALGPYEVCIDAAFVDGSLTYGDLVLPGETADEVLLSAHVCHPSMCNDNLSGIVVAAALARRLMARRRRYTYRFVLAPATLGPIVYLSRHREVARRVRHGLVLTGLGDPGPLTYKRSRRSDAAIDRIACDEVNRRGGRVREFAPVGYDERQYCSPGFDLPVGTLMRSEPGTYPQYHTSADDLAFVTPHALGESLAAVEAIVEAIEAGDAVDEPATRSEPLGPAFRNLQPFGEPQLGRRGVFDAIARHHDGAGLRLAIAWVLNLGDGEHGLGDVARRSGLSSSLIDDAADVLVGAGLLARVEQPLEVQTVGSMA